MERMPYCSLAGHYHLISPHSCHITWRAHSLLILSAAVRCMWRGVTYGAVIPFCSVSCLQLSLGPAPAKKASEKIKGTNKLGCTTRGSNGGCGPREVEKRVPRGSIHEWCGSNALRWHAAMLGTNEEDGWCTLFEIQLKDDLYVILPFVQGEELRKQAGAAAYIKCSLETHQVMPCLSFDTAFKGVLHPPRRRELMAARERN
ncbi:hypothetical protein VPH35_140029 [Triticum aestivum]